LQVARGGEEAQAFYCAADDSILVCGLLNGTANVYEINTNFFLICPDKGNIFSIFSFINPSINKSFVSII
jgi:hypothetical protein